MPLSKMECPFIPLGASSWTHVPKPLYEHTAPCAEGKGPNLQWGRGPAGGGPRVFSGCHSLVGTIGAPWCPVPLDSDSACLVF